MSIRNLNYFLKPKSVAVIGATDRPGSVGRVLMRNLLSEGFEGPIYPVHPHLEKVAGIPAFRTVADLPGVPDCAIIATPPDTVPALIADLGRKGTRAAVVITAGFGEGGREHGALLQQSMLRAAQPFDLRIIGPNCLGIQVPSAKLNASFAGTAALPGRIAFVSQSGAMATAIVDWATTRGIGFSQVLSLGDMSDVDFGDMLDFLADDDETQAILLYIEAITFPNKFMFAARTAARKKPVIAVKAGRFAEGAKAAASHTGALAGSDKVYSAAFHRAGIMRVYELEELFDAVEVLSKTGVPPGERLAILTNGGGAGVLATDALIELGGTLATLSEKTIGVLNGFLPATWSHANPVDIVGDASAERYQKSLETLLADDGVDAVLVLNCPTAVVDSFEVAQAVTDMKGKSKKTLLAVWLGGATQEKARELFEKSGLPCYETPGGGVRAFMHLVHYRQTQIALMAKPPSVTTDFQPKTKVAREIINQVLVEKDREWLSEHESKLILSAYGIPVTQSWIVATPLDAARIAREAGGPVAIKILSRDITHKSDVGGVTLNLLPEQVEIAAKAMLLRVGKNQPKAKIDGFVIEEMISRPKSFELIIGMNVDPQFGPVLLFGEGGTAVEVIDDTALELPPLDLSLAHELISRTKIFRRLKGYRDQPAIDLDALALTLVKLSRLIVDFAEIIELDINPLIADQNGVMALDARMRIKVQTV